MPEEKEPTPAPAAAEPKVLSQDHVDNVILRYTMLAAGAGLIPLPLVDFAAITAINLKMLKDLAEMHGKEFRAELAKTAVASLVASAGGGLLVIGPVASLFKAVPGLGSVVGGLAAPGAAGGMTYATGKVFAAHFAKGGDFVNFDAARFKDMFKREQKAGQEKAAKAPEAPSQTAA
ncbi:MAG TPA: DUF697 domain-containing protein [Myxococcota bacterium]|nr:DUF697 domain-containing protein [Myxococcota bacterium]HND34014.1 DUF697 domain-containing protein [Myxococcota bacterium]